MKRKIMPMLVAVATAGALLGAQPAFAAGQAATEQTPESVLVTGRGEVLAEPDVLAVDFGVEAGATTVGEAMNRAGAAATKMRNTLVRAGVARADLQTSNVGISSRTNDNRDVIGYTVTQGLTAKLRDLSKAGALMTETIAAGGNEARLNGASFAIENDAALQIEARKKAFADARKKAELYAGEAGRQLSRVVRITETPASYGEPIGQGAMFASDSRFTVEPGRQKLTATVTVEWALRPAA